MSKFLDMGANHKQQPAPDLMRDEVPGRNPFPFFMLIIILLISMFIYFAYPKFSDMVVQKEDGSYALRPERVESIRQQNQKLDEGEEVYALTASADGYYDCLHCPEKHFFLYAGEVAKYGTTGKGPKRYSAAFYKENRLNFKRLFKGSRQEALKIEKTLIAEYPLLPENLNRPAQPEGVLIRYRLARPPLNDRDF